MKEIKARDTKEKYRRLDIDNPDKPKARSVLESAQQRRSGEYRFITHESCINRLYSDSLTGKVRLIEIDSVEQAIAHAHGDNRVYCDTTSEGSRDVEKPIIYTFDEQSFSAFKESVNHSVFAIKK